MNAMTEFAKSETALAGRIWETGGSDLYQPDMPKRKRPRRGRRGAFIGEFTNVFDEALEHVDWCRRKGMTPQEVIKSIKPKEVVDYTSDWSHAIRAIEDEIRNLRAAKGKKK